MSSKMPQKLMDNSETPEILSTAQTKLDTIENELISKLSEGKAKKYVRFIMAALSSIPWVGSVIGATASFTAETEQQKLNDLQRLWLEEHREKIKDLGNTFVKIFNRLDEFGEVVQSRIESQEYLALVRKTFRSWDEADTDEKRKMYQKLITNAGAITLSPDDLIRLFINWLDIYHEAHFVVIKHIYKNSGISRGKIWDSIHKERPREDSADADLFRYLIRDLSTGGVIRQERETNDYGEFIKKTPVRHTKYGGGQPPKTMESAFEDTKPYELTSLGKQFVHYVMEDVVTQIG